MIFSEWKKLEKCFVDDEEGNIEDINGLIKVTEILYLLI